MITVAQDGSGDFTTIQSAIDSISFGPETIFIKAGTYKECVEITVDNITIIGQNSDTTTITYDNYAYMIMPDGVKRGTFRSYTFFVHANNFKAMNITFENSSGFGKDVGQAIAVYAEGDNISFSHCAILGHQDTLFTGPLPHKVKQAGGFIGPTEFSERIPGHMFFDDCYICGEIDFIFGSAIAYFKNCVLYALNRGEEINSYYTAPSTYKDQKYGYVFDTCQFTGNCPQRSVMLSRPWRIYAKVVLLNCELSEQITEIGFHDWNKPESHDTCYYAEYRCHGDGYVPDKRPAYVHQLNDIEAEEFSFDKVMNYQFKVIDPTEDPLE